MVFSLFHFYFPKLFSWSHIFATLNKIFRTICNKSYPVATAADS